ncbi:hypothetical protein F183_A26080 [Bryobacterales bacterium F-183]|nr:hypothetical protein F183_A26080 [Bryobacterales bacterium F-183]
MHWGGIVFAAAAILLRAETVPFVGCPSTGHASFPIPQSGPHRVDGISWETASKLAYYAYQHQGAYIGGGVLAPRGWQCMAWLGSSGTSLIVSPRVEVKADWEAPVGPAVIARWNAGSGRFQTGELIARAFPEYRSRLKSHFTDFGVSYVFRPFPYDTVVRRTPRIVEFQTPANRKGLGNLNGLPVAGALIYGAGVLQDGEDSFVITIRPPNGDGPLARTILRHAVSEASPQHSGTR